MFVITAMQQQSPKEASELSKKIATLADKPEQFYKAAEELGWEEGKKYSWSIK